MNETVNETVKEVVFRLRTLVYDLNTLQNRIISTLYDLLYDAGFETNPDLKHYIRLLEQDREFIKGLLKDIDTIIQKLKTITE